MIDWLISFLEGYKEASAFALGGFWASAVGVLIALRAGFRHWRTAGFQELQEKIQQLNREKEVLEKKVGQLTAERTDLAAQLDCLRDRDSENLILIAERERADANEGIALSYFKRVIAEQGTYFAQASLELAYHHLGLFELDEKHATNAYRYALLAYILSPSDQSAKSLIAELKSIKADEEIFLGNLEKAAQHFDDAYDFGIGIHGDDVMTLVTRLLNLCQREDRNGHYQTAFAISRQAHNLSQRELPAVWLEPSALQGVPIQFAAQYFYAISLQRLGHYAKALEIFKDVHAQQVKVLGIDHPDTLSSAHAVAVCLRDLGHYDEALERHEGLFAQQVKVFGADHPHVLSSTYGIAVCLRDLGRDNEALERFEDVHARRMKALGADHSDTLMCAHAITACLRGLGRHNEALERHKDEYAQVVKALGVDHPDTLPSAYGIAVCLRVLGRHSEALERLEDVHARQVSVLGIDHPDTKRSEEFIRATKSRKERDFDAA